MHMSYRVDRSLHQKGDPLYLVVANGVNITLHFNDVKRFINYVQMEIIAKPYLGNALSFRFCNTAFLCHGNEIFTP